jgi:hypothetical protein
VDCTKRADGKEEERKPKERKKELLVSQMNRDKRRQLCFE